LPVLALSVPPNSENTLVATYSDRLMRNFAVHDDFRRDLVAATRPLTIISGTDDELMFPDKYAEAVRGAAVPVDVRLLDGINHMGIIAAPKAVSLIAEDVATRGMAGS
jgi:pimeloyl-ACP methyl ester carboxylesterase